MHAVSEHPILDTRFYIIRLSFLCQVIDWRLLVKLCTPNTVNLRGYHFVKLFFLKVLLIFDFLLNSQIGFEIFLNLSGQLLKLSFDRYHIISIDIWLQLPSIKVLGLYIDFRSETEEKLISLCSRQ